MLIRDTKYKSEVTGLPLIDVTDAKQFKNIEFMKRDLFSAKLGTIFYADKFRDEWIMYGGEYIDVKNKIHIAIVSTDPDVKPYSIRSRIIDTDTNFKSHNIVNLVRMEKPFSIIIYNGNKFVIASVKKIILEDDKMDISFKVRHVITDTRTGIFPEKYLYDLSVMREIGHQVMNDDKPIPQSLLARVNGRSSMYSKVLLMTRNKRGQFESVDSLTGKIYVLDEKCKWVKENKHDNSIQTVVMKVGFPKSQNVLNSDVIRCFGEAYPENMVYDISKRNRSLIEMRKRLKDPDKCKFRINEVETPQGKVLMMDKYNKTYILYSYGRNNSKIGKCLLG